MPTALHIAVPPSQPRQGVGARLVRRLGGAVRTVIVRGITLAGALRRPATSQTSHHRTAAQDPQAPAPRRLSAPHRPRPPSTSTSPAPRAWAAKQTKACPGLDRGSPAKRAGEGAAPLPPPWLAHLLAARRQRCPAATSRPTCLNRGDIHFTPQAFPQLNAKACAVLNTPLKDCDPKTLKLLVSAFTQHINQVMSPEAGIADRAAAFPNLLHRLNAALAHTNADASLSITPQAAAATPTDAMPDAPIASPQPPPTAPTTQWTNHAPRLSLLPLSGPPASDPPADPAITVTASQTTPDIAAPSAPAVHVSRSLSTPGRSFQYHTQPFARLHRHPARSPRHGRPMGPTFTGRHLPPVSARQCRPKNVILYRRYAASTGPPRGIARRILGACPRQ